MDDKVQKHEEEINLMKEKLHIIQTTKPSLEIGIDAKLVDFEDRPRQNNLKFEGMK